MNWSEENTVPAFAVVKSWVKSVNLYILRTEEVLLWVIHNINLNMEKWAKEKLQPLPFNLLIQNVLLHTSKQAMPCHSPLETCLTLAFGHIHTALISLQETRPKYHNAPRIPCSQKLWHNLGHNAQFRNCCSGAFYMAILAEVHLPLFCRRLKQCYFRINDSSEVQCFKHVKPSYI